MHKYPLLSLPHTLLHLEANARAGTIPVELLHPLFLTLWNALYASAPWPFREEPAFQGALRAARNMEEPLLAWLALLENLPPTPESRKEDRDQDRWDQAQDASRQHD